MNFKASVTIFLLSAFWVALTCMEMPAQQARQVVQYVGFFFVALWVSVFIGSTGIQEATTHRQVTFYNTMPGLALLAYVLFVAIYPFTF